VRRELDKFALVQLFEQVHYVEKNYQGDLAKVVSAQNGYRSIALCLNQGELTEENFSTPGTGERYRHNPGMAWAARRSTLQSLGFYDAQVLGGGDKAMFSAACGRSIEYTKVFRATSRWKTHYLAWAERFYEVTRGRIGYLEGDLLHLWHGDLGDRRYTKRYTLFAPFGFDPYADIALSKSGVWHWSSNKPEMHDFVREHFENVENPSGSNVPPQNSSPSLSAP
jgi:hypothetical protein